MVYEVFMYLIALMAVGWIFFWFIDYIELREFRSVLTHGMSVKVKFYGVWVIAKVVSLDYLQERCVVELMFNEETYFFNIPINEIYKP